MARPHATMQQLPDVHVIADVAASDSPSWRLHRAFTYNMDSARPMDTDDTNFLVRRPVEDLGESPLMLRDLTPRWLRWNTVA